MPHLLKETTNKDEMMAGPPFGPGVCRDIAEKAARMEVWGSNFNEPGPDYCEFRLYDVAGIVVDRRRVDGY